MSIKILLSDHNKDSGAHLTSLLADGPVETLLSVAGDLKESLAYLEQAEFDLILLDLSPAVTSTAYFALKQHDQQLPILILTNAEDEHLAIEAVQAGAQGYLLKKHLTTQGLIHHMRQAIKHHHLGLDSQKREASFRNSLQCSMAGAVVVDREGVIRFVNEVAATLFARPANTFVGEKFDYPLTPSDSMALNITLPNGQVISCERITLAIDWQGEPHTLVWLSDTTLYNQAERELRTAAIELQNRNEELDAFAHTVAHDLLNPLSLITGYAQLFEETYQTVSSDTLKTYLHGIIWNGYKMQEIIEALLLLASTRQEDVYQEPIEMGYILNDVRRRLAHMLREHRAELQMPGQWPTVWGYGPWIEEVWINYISNAIKYGGSPPRIVIGADPPQQGQIRFWVRDNGAGILPGDQTKLFSAFPNLNPNGLRDSKGNGLGLSIVRRIIERLLGQTGIESTGQISEGSLFYFTLPTSPSKNIKSIPD